MYKKQLCFTLAFLFFMLVLTGTNYSQWQYTVKAGVNSAQQATGSPVTRLTLGAGVQTKVDQNVSLQAELLYVQAGANFTVGFDGSYNTVKAKLDYVQFPVLFKIPVYGSFFGEHNGPSVYLGPYFAFLLHKQIQEENKLGDSVMVASNIGQTLSSFDIGVIGGVQYEFMDSFFADARYTVGLKSTNLYIRDRSYANQVITLSLGYRF